MKFVSCDGIKFDSKDDCLNYERTLIKAYNRDGDRVEYSADNYWGEGDPADEIKAIVIDNEELLSLFILDFGTNEGVDGIGTYIWDEENKIFTSLKSVYEGAKRKLDYITNIKNKIEGDI